ncbi:MAG TPA: amino acid adenylation domain-containing protein, partial [Longimicrobiaceae bacterium]|nr:amino acid adenylation domain-containing protein [Longimicrobiaceae bacterium]
EPLLVERLEAAARRHQLTLNTLFAGAWGALLAAWAGADDVVFGSVAAGRAAQLPGAEGMLGVFVNTVPVRVRARPGEPAPDALRAVQAQQLRARAHEHWPPARVQEWSGVPRGRRLFETMLVFQNLPDVGVQLAEVAGLRLRDFERASPPAGVGYSLVLEVVPRAGLELRLVHDLARFDADAAGRLLGHLRAVLEALAEDPRRPLAELPLLGPAERRQIAEWSAPRPLPDSSPVHLRFAAQAARTPDAVAVAAGGGAVTYAELDRRSDLLADELRRRFVGPEVPVAVCADRSPALPVAVLAVWKAGGAFVPLDPSHPAERLAFVLADSGAAVLVAQDGIAERLPEFGGEVCVVSDAGTPLPRPLPRKGGGETGTGPDTLSQDRERVASLNEPGGGALAYVLYTSGSTGAPKGVRVEHRQLAATLDAARAAFAAGPGDVMPALASHAFDIWLLETFLPLLAGATVRLVAAERVRDVPALVREELGDATLLHAVPALMRQVVEEAVVAGSRLPLRQVFVGGDAVPPELLERMRSAWPGARAWVLYGPTEGTIVCAAGSFEAGPPAAARPMGRPLGSASLHVRSPAGELLPVGVPGELCIGGAGVARDYLGRPELTAERFVPDPFAGEPGARLYRTGDRARWLPDGTLEFLGRADAQVKLRGFRIEPGEVEAALAAHPAVRDAAVVLRELPGGPALVAYYVPAADAGSPLPPPRVDEGVGLRDWLRARLPDYMVPSALVALDALPLTPTGKLDRAALPAPESADGAEPHVAPRGPTEELVAAAYGDVLGGGPVGAEADFFERGGHSLMATRLVSRLREAFGVEVPLGALFEAPTVAGLAARVEALLREGAATQAPPLVPLPRDGRPLPLSFAQQRLWFLDRMEPGSAAYNMPAALRIRGPLDAEALRRALSEVVRRHEALRTAIGFGGGEPVQVVRDPAPFPLETVDLRGRPEAEREAELLRRAREEAARPFDLEEGPLVRATLLRLGDEDAALLFTMHHVVGDGWSVGLLVREVSALYYALARGEEPRLPPPAVQYADFAAWQREWLRGDVLDAQVAWWRERLAGAPPVLELPADHP